MKERWMEIGLVSEASPRPQVERAYRDIRAGLGVDYVPALYQALASYEHYFDTCIETAVHVISGPRALEFEREAAQLANQLVARFPPNDLHLGDDVSVVAQHARNYQTSNPRNLLFVLAIDATSVERRTVMATAPKSDTVGQGRLADDIAELHGSFVVPGFWKKSLSSVSQETVAITWDRVRPLAGTTPFFEAQLALVELAREYSPKEIVPRPEALGYSPDDAADISDMLSWFKQALPSLILEVAYVDRLLRQQDSAAAVPLLDIA
ncbi:hypothetical protein [Microbacterium sp. GXF0217]